MATRLTPVLLLMLCIMLLVACGGGTARDESEPPSVAEPSREAVPTTREEPPPLNQEQANPGVETASIDGVISPGEYSHQQTIAQVSVSWLVEGKNLRMAMSAPCTGYISVGFDPEFRKEGGNYIIGYVDGETVVVRDHVGTRGNLHEADTDLGGEDNILEFSGTEINGQTTLEFIIPMDSGDSLDQPLAPGARHILLVAYQESRDDLISVHTRHGVAQIEL